ncbi:hypothetical protein [Brachybacterium hainanense]|uniref:Uncharacterized protein n=1 Tax=Brachybacterium hainanense TaxID=1541174 RepID=A0ABV6RC34_9MICO
MTDDTIRALWDAIEARTSDPVEQLELARQERIRASRRLPDHLDYRDPALSVPGRIDAERRRPRRRTP